jgi:ribonuclease HII
VARKGPTAASALWLRDRAFSQALGGRPLIGADEVGRGCLAGPVVACAVLSPEVLPESLAGINDSKKLLPARRLTLYRALRAAGVKYALGFATPEEIDRINILKATHLAMQRAISILDSRFSIPDSAVLLVDGNQKIAGVTLPQKTVVGGDARSFIIAAASVAAKVVRDRWMRLHDARHPGYNFAVNKGYGTPDHLEGLSRLGPCAAHRRSFAPVRQPALELSKP